MTKNNILIIGAGLSGTCLARQLLKKGHAVQLIDRGENHSTAIAAGMMNPMVFRRMNKSWRLDEFVKEAKAFYLEMEELLQQPLFHPLIIRRMLSSEQERNYWLERERLPEFQEYLTPITPEDEAYSQADNPFGSGRVNAAFWIDAHAFYHANLNQFFDQNMLLKESFDAAQFDAEHLSYKGVNYDKVVFCVGYEQMNTPFFSELPIQQTKGQTLRIRSNEIPENESLNRKCFVLPLGDQVFRIGATYEWDNPDLTPTEEAKNELVNHLSVLGNYDYEIIDQQVGIRPTVLDRRPILGEHQHYKNIYLFNGLGTKGYLMAPTLSRELSECMLEGTPLDKEISIERFYRKSK